MQDIQAHLVFIGKTVKSFAFVTNSVVFSVNYAENRICDVSMYAQAMKLLNAKNLRNRRMSAMVVRKRHIVLCQENFIHQNMHMMNIEVYWLIAELASIKHRKVFKP